MKSKMKGRVQQIILNSMGSREKLPDEEEHKHSAIGFQVTEVEQSINQASTIQSAQSASSNERMGEFEHKNTHQDFPLNIPSMRFQKGDGEHNPIDMNESQQLNGAFMEPKFCWLIPLSRGLFCGFLSLKNALFLIALIDITFGGAALGIGITAFLKLHLHLSLVTYVILNGICFLLAILSIFAICVNHQRTLRYYFLWKLGEVVVLTIFELLVMSTSDQSSELHHALTANYYVFALLKALTRLFFAYLIYSYNYRRDLGEHLLIDYGERRLKKMIEQIQREQDKQQWDLEMTDRVSRV
ncbi:hypothetical protein FGO68_gene6224 [Halteria grandinella]|uniref:Transmembrane protein n=1 Tax=Halteria grandinella TaxID=5974 RepID=A0A8J8NKI2_HALGN|nr:hypothetical protein FGO68_gene6224 [Halteria grandinella]